jgi:hypothetical protein
VPSGTAIAATWVDDLSVATLIGSARGTTVTSYELGGMQTSLGRPGDAVSIVGGNGTDTLRVVGADHVVQVPTGSTWSSTGVAVDLIATQQ